MKMLRAVPHLFLLSLFLLAFIALAQSPGQYPPGQYPPGQYPPNRLPRIPGQTGPIGGPRPGQPSTDSRGRRSNTDAKSLGTTTSGILRRVAPNQLVIQADDHRVIWYRLAAQLTVRKDGKDASLSDFALGDFLSVDSNADDDGNFTAVAVSWKKAATPEDRAEAARDWDLPRIETVARNSAKPAPSSASSPPREPGDDRPVMRRKNPEPQPEADAAPEPKETAAAPPPPEAAPKQEEADNSPPATVMRPPDAKPDADDPGKPALRRGVPAPRRQTASVSPAPDEAPVSIQPAAAAVGSAAAPSAEAIPLGDDPVIAKAREEAIAYSQTLPNYLVQQMTTRYQSDHPKQGWSALDVVSADVTYQDGHESYKNIKVGNKSVNTPMDQIAGTRSTGEFSTLLEQLFENGAVKFRSGGQDTIRSRPALVYSFEIPRELSHWQIAVPSQLYYPAIKGSVWIDKQTSRVLRIEQQGRGLPALFPLDTIETSADYDFVRLGTSGPYLLPVEAEVLSCHRGTGFCSRNKIEFRNYRKFGAETNITFDNQN